MGLAGRTLGHGEWLVGWVRGRGQAGAEPDVMSEPDVTADPTPIRISKRTRTAMVLAEIVGVIVAVPTLAVLRVHFAIFRVRLTTEG